MIKTKRFQDTSKYPELFSSTDTGANLQEPIDSHYAKMQFNKNFNLNVETSSIDVHLEFKKNKLVDFKGGFT